MTPELYFIENATDARGRRVRDPAGPENWIWPPGADDIDVSLLGISEGQSKAMEAFFSGAGQPGGAVGRGIAEGTGCFLGISPPMG